MENGFEIISYEDIATIRPNMMGYIDKEGNFWSLGTTKLGPFNNFYEKSFEGMGTIAQKMALYFLNEEAKDEFLKLDSDYQVNYHLPYFWQADKLLKGLGFVRFFRGYYDHEESYVELSDYEGANLKQLGVMNYLFALNYSCSTNIEIKRIELYRAYLKAQELEKDQLKRTLNQ